jgi:hypothetical protein
LIALEQLNEMKPPQEVGSATDVLMQQHPQALVQSTLHYWFACCSRGPRVTDNCCGSDVGYPGGGGGVIIGDGASSDHASVGPVL